MFKPRIEKDAASRAALLRKLLARRDISPALRDKYAQRAAELEYEAALAA